MDRLTSRTKPTTEDYHLAEQAIAETRLHDPVPAHLSDADYIGKAIRLLTLSAVAGRKHSVGEDQVEQARRVLRKFERRFARIGAMLKDIEL